MQNRTPTPYRSSPPPSAVPSGPSSGGPTRPAAALRDRPAVGMPTHAPTHAPTPAPTHAPTHAPAPAPGPAPTLALPALAFGLSLALALAVTACDSPPQRADRADGPPDASAPADTTLAPDILDPDSTPTPPLPEVPPSFLAVIDTMGFTRVGDDDTVPGFDLDGRISDITDRLGCGHADLTSPDGQTGIDNQLATLVPLFELAGIGAAEGLIQDAIKDGGLILMFQVDDVDDLQNDPEVTLMIRAGTGVPLLGTDGILLAGQTFAVHPESPDSKAPVADITDGVLTAGPFHARLPVSVFGVSYVLNFFDARITARLTEDGGLTDGLIGGAVPFTDLLAIGTLAARDDASVLPAIELVFSNALDLNPDEAGLCTAISGTFRFTAVSGFLY